MYYYNIKQNLWLFTDVCRGYSKYQKCAEVTDLERYCATHPQVEFFKTTISYICNEGKDKYLENVKCLAKVDYPYLIKDQCHDEQMIAQSSAKIAASVFQDEVIPWKKPLSSSELSVVKDNLCVQLKYNKCVSNAVLYECGGGAVDWMNELALHQLQAGHQGKLTRWTSQQC